MSQIEPQRLPPLDSLEDAQALAMKRVGFSSDMLERAEQLYSQWARQSAADGNIAVAAAQLIRAGEFKAWRLIEQHRRGEAA